MGQPNLNGKTISLTQLVKNEQANHNKGISSSQVQVAPEADSFLSDTMRNNLSHTQGRFEADCQDDNFESKPVDKP